MHSFWFFFKPTLTVFWRLIKVYSTVFGDFSNQMGPICDFKIMFCGGKISQN